MANQVNKNTVYVDTTGTLVSSPAVILRVILHANDAADGTLHLRDGGAGGNVVFACRVDDPPSEDFDLSTTPIVCTTDVHATITGTGAEAIVILGDNPNIG